MLPFEGGKLNEVVQGPLPGPLGNVSMRLAPPLVKQDFYAQYGQPTFWPYCESLERCVVYRCATLHCSCNSLAALITAALAVQDCASVAVRNGDVVAACIRRAVQADSAAMLHAQPERERGGGGAPRGKSAAGSGRNRLLH
jgi:hypothetical protein